MSDLAAIVERAQALSDPHEGVLATVITTDGSTYRQSGARALFLHGETVGLIGGGCLESDMEQRAAEVREAGRARLVEYDHRDLPTDLLWGHGLGCAGALRVLFEPLAASAVLWLQRVVDTRHSMVIEARLDAIDSEGWMVPIEWSQGDESASAFGTERDASDRVSYREVINPPLRLLIVGHGVDTHPLAAIASAMGWSVERRAPATFAQPVALDRATACVLMTHNAARDIEWLARLIVADARWIGMLGSRDRRDWIFDELAKRGLDRAALQRRVCAPLGLKLGGEGPQAIALAAAAEIQQAFAAAQAVDQPANDCARGSATG
ncbi:XdhC family protein [Gammaproteobacteria bacterium]|nr:XdhC family protein [Gammaproteobacteria bacterium]